MGLFSRSTSASTSPARRRDMGVRTRALAERSATAENNDRSESHHVFRRNRTLSNAEKAPVNSISPRAIHHHLRGKRRSLSLLLLASLTLVCLFTFLLYQLSAQFTITLYGSIGAVPESDQRAYQQTIDTYLGHHPGQRLRLFLDEDMLVGYLQTHGHGEVDSIVSVKSSGLAATTLEIKAREPVARWVVGGKLEYVDKNGIVFSKNYYTSPNIKIVDNSGISTANGTVTSSRFLAFVGRIIGALKDYGYETSEVIIPAGTTRQVQIKTTSGIIIKFAVDRPAGEQAEDAARALTYMAQNTLAPTYIDVRVSGRAYYK